MVSKRKQCEAKTFKTKERCRLAAVVSSNYCHLHLYMDESSKELNPIERIQSRTTAPPKERINIRLTKREKDIAIRELESLGFASFSRYFRWKAFNANPEMHNKINILWNEMEVVKEATSDNYSYIRKMLGEEKLPIHYKKKWCKRCGAILSTKSSIDFCTKCKEARIKKYETQKPLLKPLWKNLASMPGSSDRFKKTHGGQNDKKER